MSGSSGALYRVVDREDLDVYHHPEFGAYCPVCKAHVATVVSVFGGPEGRVIGFRVTLDAGYVNAGRRAAHPWYRPGAGPARRIRIPAILSCTCGSIFPLDEPLTERGERDGYRREAQLRAQR